VGLMYVSVLVEIARLHDQLLDAKPFLILCCSILLPQATCINCRIPFCGDMILNPQLGEQCDEGAAMPSPTCANCRLVTSPPTPSPVLPETIPPTKAPTLPPTLPPTKGPTLTPTFPPTLAPTPCVCQASAEYSPTTGGVTIEFDMCGEEPLSSDFIGIYPCEADTLVADQTWWNGTVCRQFPAACGGFQFGYNEGEEYVNQIYTWFTYTCGPPEDGGCQTVDEATTWPSKGIIDIDPNNSGANWAYPGGRTLEPGCYKVQLQREMYFISPPPFRKCD